MVENMKIGVIGLGLIGGSLAKATVAFTEHEVYGYDIDDDIVLKALEKGSIHHKLTDELVKDIDLLLLAVRPSIAIEYINRYKELSLTIIDMCGVKRHITSSIQPFSTGKGFRYIGGHPMAGLEVGGYENSRWGLFRGAIMILVPHDHFSVPFFVKEFFFDIGFHALELTDDFTHDRIIAYTSQLAHVVSNAFVKSKTATEHDGYSADSLRDLTRVATLDADMWTELFMLNRDNLIVELDTLIGNLTDYSATLKNDDPKKLKSLLEEGVVAKSKMYPKNRD